MHRFASEARDEPKAEQVEIAVHEAVQTEFRFAVLACLMVNHLFADAGKAGILGEIRNIAVHFAVDFDVFHHIAAIGFQSAVEVVEVLDAAHFAMLRKSLQR